MGHTFRFKRKKVWIFCDISCYFYCWTHECIFTKLSCFGCYTLLGWSWTGRWSCAFFMVFRIYPCPPERILDGGVSSILDCWHIIRGIISMEFPGLVLSAFIVDYLGRKLSMAVMFFSCGAFLIPLIVPQHEAMTTSLLFGARLCINGAFAIVYVYAPEIYPTSIRSTGFGAASSFSRIGGIVCPLIAVGLVENCHQASAIFLFEFVLLSAGVSVMLFPVETKGQALSDTDSSR
uniref:Major facilitator superfamily (MFS) profile domain-containing protein n=1 Tax=Araucaria cunninghamii TaxID=56994 RepID=A0A0D6QTX9_ARACU